MGGKVQRSILRQDILEWNISGSERPRLEVDSTLINKLWFLYKYGLWQLKVVKNIVLQSNWAAFDEKGPGVCRFNTHFQQPSSESAVPLLDL